MRLWKKAAGALKDQNSLWLANTTYRSAIRNPDIEKNVIRATAHNGLVIDPRAVDRVRRWLAISPANLKPLLWAISSRVDKTADWIVTLKSLYLIHILINTQLPSVARIGRLPFDLSGFRDGHIPQLKAWPFNGFIRAYYAFLDHKSVVVFQEKASPEKNPVARELVFIQKFQGLVDLLLQIKPQREVASVPMIRDVMDVVIVEVREFYGRVCRGIAVILMNIYSAGRTEATAALNLVLKAMRQGQDVISYLESCEEIGIVRESDIPVIDMIPEEGIHELRQIVEHLADEKQETVKSEFPANQTPRKTVQRLAGEKQVTENARKSEPPAINGIPEKGINNNSERQIVPQQQLMTIITENWEKFDEEIYPHRMEELPDLIIL
ncbi:hypothetical protein M569_11647 [Genlisea aurea]|uniref:ENTH domain-containing protein n=1 Tax=Genlisea aurea TaxID=192259 RepID=S8C8E9_9LAMI|nr:hypothetical protein M569_11647 [Genlisea aurea]